MDEKLSYVPKFFQLIGGPCFRFFLNHAFRFLVSDQASGVCSEGCQGIVDTGTSLLTVPESYLSTLMQAIGAEESLFGEVGVVWWRSLPAPGDTGPKALVDSPGNWRIAEILVSMLSSAQGIGGRRTWDA
jgi:hypothetical protein